MIMNDEFSIIGQLVNFSDDRDLFEKKIEMAEKLLIQLPEIDKKFQDLICKFIEDPNVTILNKIRIYAVNHSYWLTASNKLVVIAWLVDTGSITQEYAAEILSGLSENQRSILKPKELKLLEIADMVYEDYREGFLKVDEDNLFLTSLKEIAR